MTKKWIAAGGWMTLLLVGILLLPAMPDLYIPDHYFIGSKVQLLMALCALGLVPLAIATIRSLRSVSPSRKLSEFWGVSPRRR
jgi:hypothetical protein